jgi:integrase
LQGVIKVPPAIHHKPIPSKAIPDFIEKIDADPGRMQTKLAGKLLLFTMVRKCELVKATWEEVDLESAVWTIPEDRMKRRLGHLVPLSTQALDLFRKLQSFAGSSQYVFPNLGDPRKHMSPGTPNLLFERMGLDVSPHSLRATASTVLNESNQFRSDAIERQLAHIDKNQTRGSYNAAEYIDERRAMLQWWADFIDRPPNVVAMRMRPSRAQ